MKSDNFVCARGEPGPFTASVFPLDERCVRAGAGFLLADLVQAVAAGGATAQVFAAAALRFGVFRFGPASPKISQFLVG